MSNSARTQRAFGPKLVVAGLLILFAMGYAFRRYSPPAYRSAASAARGANKISSMSDLKSRIDSGRAPIAALEAKLRSKSDTMKAMDLRLDSLETDLEFMKRRLDAGIATGADQYKSTIDTYNDLVDRRHLLYLAYNADFDRYNEIWGRQNALIAQYNARSRSNAISAIPIELAIRMAELRAIVAKPVDPK
jgi:hypothetical protein